LGSTNIRTCERCVDKDNSASHILYDYEATAYLRFRQLAVKFPDWCERRNKKFKEIKNCFIFIQNNLRLLEYMCWIV
jgi:hypothetical protein